MSEEHEQQAPLWQEEARAQGPVECLGVTFESDEARRAHFLEKLREKLKDPEFRRIEGFPIGEDEDILRLSDPPYYTACPNPFIEDFIRCYGKPYDPERDDYRREPFAADVSEGKGDAIYSAHAYHTKVPHKAIMRYILHYTEPGDVVYDGFCGSGMAGVAAQLCGDRQAVEALGYRVLADGTVLDEQGNPFSRLGARRAILNDLSPAATFIAYNYNTPVDVAAFEREARRILRELEDECGWMYETWHPHCDDANRVKARINYTVWSEVFRCPQCSGEISFLNEALDGETSRVRERLACPHCGTDLTKRDLERFRVAYLDPILGRTVETLKRQPALIEYTVGRSKYSKAPDPSDLEILDRIDQLSPGTSVPCDPLPIAGMYHGSRLGPKGVTHIHHLFLSRARCALAALWQKVQWVGYPRQRAFLVFAAEQSIWGMSLLNRYQPIQFGRPGGSQVNRYLSGVYYISSLISEVSPWYILGGKVERLTRAFGALQSPAAGTIVSTLSATAAPEAESSIDYVFTDPPFGENIPYADLNFIVESWHRVRTDTGPEAVVDQPKHKGLHEYQELMTASFRSYYQRLKPGRWMTVEFHNSHNAVWNAIQEALWAAGFVVADVRGLDKQTGSYRQVTTTKTTKQDLVISAYKPNGGLAQRFELEAGSEDGAWDFVRTHLRQLPIFVARNGRAVRVTERVDHLLYDRMVAFHVQRGVTVPLSAAELYAGLAQRFHERDGMYYLPEQAAEYDRKKLAVRGVEQLQLLVTDEASAIQWLRARLAEEPQTFQELHPQFMREIAGWEKHEKPLELWELLEQSFLRYEGQGEVPPQIQSCLAAEDASLAGRSADDPALAAAARDRWYVPDPNRAADLEKLRERALLRKFDEYRQSKERRLKVFRLEAVRAGFKRAWQEKDYGVITEVARKIPEDVLQEDAKLLMWLNQAETRLGEG